MNPISILGRVQAAGAGTQVDGYALRVFSGATVLSVCKGPDKWGKTKRTGLQKNLSPAPYLGKRAGLHGDHCAR